MDFSRLVALVYLEEFKIEEVGFAEAPYVFQFDLVLPRPSIDDASRHLVVKNISGEQTDWTDKPLTDRLLFKEIVEGPLAIALSVYPAEDRFFEQFTDLLPRFGAEIADQYLTQLNLRFTTLRQIFGTAQEASSKDVKRSLEKSFATGNKEFIPTEEKELILEIPLTVPQRIKNPRPDLTPEDNRPEDDHSKFIKEAGESNGFVKLKIQLVER